MGLFGGTTTTTRENTIDPEVSRGSEWATQRALNINSRPYQPYQGSRIAGLSDQEQRASTIARRTAGRYSPYYDRSREMSRSASADFNPNDLVKYQSQYQTNVTDPTLDRLRQRGAGRIKSIEQNKNKTSAFGDMTNRKGTALSQLNEGLSDAQNVGDYEGYDYAMQNYSKDKQNEAMLADRYMNMGNTAGALNSLDINRLMSAGRRERGVNQNQANFDYSQYLEGRDWDQNRLDQLVRTLGGVEYDRTTTGTGSGGSNLGGALGGLASAYGGYLSGQSPEDDPTGSKDSVGIVNTAPLDFEFDMSQDYERNV